jgi:glycosyltransferase involved in cell wall biosynthesis
MPHGTLTNYQARQHRKRKFLVNIIFRKIIANAASIIVATDIEKIQIESKFKSRVDKVGIGLEIKVRSMVEEKVKIGRNFLFLGRIAEKKRIDITIKAFALFLADFPDAELTIAGDGDPKLISKLKILVSKLAISSSVKFVSWVSGDEKFKLYERTDYFVLNSEDENFAIAVAEAQSHGIPVLISKFVAFSEIVTDFESGVIVESLDIETVLAGMRTINEANYADLSRNSLQSANAVSWNSVIEKWVSVILDIDSK